MQESSVLITNDAVVLGLMVVILGAVFYTSHSDNRFFNFAITY